jgi:peptidoglycan hydrolase-like protein with peptidoglycan-binding domain
MISTHTFKNVVLSGLVAFGMAGIAEAGDYYSQATVRSAQTQLENDGYYGGPVDGIDGPLTHQAIRRFQRDNNLEATGRLNRATQDQLGVQYSSEVNPPEANTVIAPSSATVTAAQRSLQRSGFYKGNLDGLMGPETEAAVREYQKNSNLEVTGQLDPSTLNNLGVSK